MKIRDKILEYNMFDVFDGIKFVYGYEMFNKFIIYLKSHYNLDSNYHYSDIIDVMSEDEIALNIRVFFDSDDKRHIPEFGKDINNEQLLDWLFINCYIK
jgi:hypothetical protein